MIAAVYYTFKLNFILLQAINHLRRVDLLKNRLLLNSTTFLYRRTKEFFVVLPSTFLLLRQTGEDGFYRVICTAKDTLHERDSNPRPPDETPRRYYY